MKTVQITYDKDAEEYRVPGPHKSKEEAGAYYTGDLHDALGTAADMYARAGYEAGGLCIKIPKGKLHEKRLNREE